MYSIWCPILSNKWMLIYHLLSIDPFDQSDLEVLYMHTER